MLTQDQHFETAGQIAGQHSHNFCAGDHMLSIANEENIQTQLGQSVTVLKHLTQRSPTFHRNVLQFISVDILYIYIVTVTLGRSSQEVDPFYLALHLYRCYSGSALL